MANFVETISQPNFSEIDNQINDWWKQNHIFETSVDLSAGAKDYIFYDGPPFMSGMPHYATLLSSLPKDAIPRFQTMKGMHVERLWGWDCHGLPIENKVEEQLGLNGRKQILEYGLEPFIAKCYEWNRVGIENWRWYIEKIGRWADMDNAYRTLDQDYMESVWWAFKTMWDKGLIYEGKRTSMYSTDSSTPVSSFEVSMDPDNYRDTEDLAVTVKFKLQEEGARSLVDKLGLKDIPVYLLAWTTTPWTLPNNFALAINPELEYVAVEQNDELFILAKTRLSAIFGEDTQVSGQLKAADIEGKGYYPLYDFLPGNSSDFKVYSSDYVTGEDGTGILHVAPAFGEADFAMGQQFGLSDTSDIDEAGKLTVGPWTGTYLRAANQPIADDLQSKGLLFKQEKYTHRLPYYRYKNPLIYKTQSSYFLDITKLKPQLLRTIDETNWIPEHFKDGRFRYTVETAPDWSISRSRFWGTTMPLWQAESGKKLVIGSRDELMKLVNNGKVEMQKVIISLVDNRDDNAIRDLEAKLQSGQEVIEIAATQDILSQIRQRFGGETEAESKVKLLKPGERRAYYLYQGKALDMHRPFIDNVTFIHDGETFNRVAETLDVWMDSGSMPFAQFHYPFEHKEKFENSFPGDFIAEYTGQIRAWFYVLHVLANALFDKPAFKNVLVTGVLAGNDGRKMSKSFKNYPDPKETLNKYGGDALRLYFLGSTLMNGNDMNFSEEELQMQVREFLIPLWNIYKYFTTYAQMHDYNPDIALTGDSAEFLDRLSDELDVWVVVRAQQTIAKLDNAIGKYTLPTSVKELRELLSDISKWYIRRSRDRFVSGTQESLEVLYYLLTSFVRAAAPIIPFTTEYIYRNLVAEQFAEAPQSVHFTKYPALPESLTTENSKLLEEMALVREISELGQTLRTTNALKVRQPLAKLEVQSSLEGFYLSDWMKQIIADELNVLEVVEVAQLSTGEQFKTMDTRNGQLKVALDSALTPELEAAGTLREVIRSIQAQRKAIGLQMGEKANVQYQTSDEKLLQLMTDKKSEIMSAVSASSLLPGNGDVELAVNGAMLKLTVSKA